MTPTLLYLNHPIENFKKYQNVYFLSHISEIFWSGQGIKQMLTDLVRFSEIFWSGQGIKRMLMLWMPKNCCCANAPAFVSILILQAD